MYLRKNRFYKLVFALPGILVVVLVLGFFVSGFVKDMYSPLLGKIPFVNKWVEKQHLNANVYEPQVTYVEDNKDSKNLTDAVLDDDAYEIPESADIVVGAFKKEEVEASSPGGERISKTFTTTVVEDDERRVKNVKIEVDLCRAASVKGWVYLTVPKKDIVNPKSARIKAPLLQAGSSFGMLRIPDPKGSDKYIYVVSKDENKLAKEFIKISDSYGKKGRIDKRQVRDFLVDFLVSLNVSTEDKKKGDLAPLFFDPHYGGIIAAAYGFNPANLSGTLVGGNPQEYYYKASDLRDAVEKKVDALIYGKNEDLEENGIADSPELKACREFLSKKDSEVTFVLRNTSNIPADYKKGAYVPKNGNAVYGFLTPPESTKTCEDGCYMSLSYFGSSAVILFNQMNVCITALSKVNGAVRLPQESYDNVVKSDCLGTLCSSSVADVNAVRTMLATAHVFDFTNDLPIARAVVDEDLAAKIMNAFKPITDAIKSIFSRGTNGMYRTTGKPSDPHGSIVVPVECTCATSSKEDLENYILRHIRKEVRPFLKPLVSGLAGSLHAQKYGTSWNCTVMVDALALSSSLDTPFSKVTEATADASLARTAVESTSNPQNALHSYNWLEVAESLGRSIGCSGAKTYKDKNRDGSKTNTSDKDKADSERIIKDYYKENYNKMPFLLHQLAIFDTYPPVYNRNKSAPVNLPSIFKRPKEEFVQLPVYSTLFSGFQMTNTIAGNKKLPSTGAKQPDNRYYEALLCTIGLYFNVVPGHMQFVCQNNNVAEATFVSDLGMCADLKPEDYEQIIKDYSVNDGEYKIEGKFGSVGGLFKD